MAETRRHTQRRQVTEAISDKNEEEFTGREQYKLDDEEMGKEA